MKIVTICGSMKFMNEMMIVAQKLAFQGYCVLTPIYPVIQNIEITEKKLCFLKDAHFKKIDLSDLIYVIDKDGYIGESTRLEIEYAKSLGKDIVYYSDGEFYE